MIEKRWALWAFFISFNHRSWTTHFVFFSIVQKKMILLFCLYRLFFIYFVSFLTERTSNKILSAKNFKSFFWRYNSMFVKPDSFFTWQLDNLSTCQLDNLTTWQLDNLRTWQLDNLTTWLLDNLTTWQLDSPFKPYALFFMIVFLVNN